MNSEGFAQRILVFLFRVSIGWVFLGAALRQIPNAEWSAAGFMRGSPNFSFFFETMASPPFIQIINVVIPWAHLLIGLALILGVAMRLAAIGGATLMVLYYIPRFDFPSVIVEYHIVYAGLIAYLALIRAGQVYGIETWVKEKSPLKPLIERYSLLRVVMS